MLAQAVSDASVMDSLVAYGIAAPLVLWLVWQLRTDRATFREEVGEYKKALEKEQGSNRELFERLIKQQEAMLPIVTSATEALSDTADLLRKSRVG